MDSKKQKMEIAVTSMILAIAAYLQYVAYHTKIRENVAGMRSMTFPKIILYVIMLLCLIVIFGGVRNLLRLNARQREHTGEKKPVIRGKIVITAALIVVYALMWNVVGFLLSSLVFVFAESLLLDRSKPWWHAFVIAAVYTAIVYAVFGVCFNVSFPEPLLELILG